jgi:signal transduction histidine kinase
MVRPRSPASGSASSTFPASLVIGPVIGEGHEINGYVAIARDISERKAIERMKDDFLSTVSHELRTPLTSILGSLGLVMGGVAGSLPAEASALLAIAHSNSERLLSLVNDILDVQKLESGLFELRIATCDLREVVQRAVELTAPFVQGHGVTLVVSADPGPLLASADFDRLVQVLVNLLSNAAKFSPKGEVVTVSLERLVGRARITVGDRGAGIPEAFRAKIFSKFMQASTGDASRRGGTGLGLSIVKSIVELHGGTVAFQTEQGVGTRFFVEVPA